MLLLLPKLISVFRLFFSDLLNLFVYQIICVVVCILIAPLLLLLLLHSQFIFLDLLFCLRLPILKEFLLLLYTALTD